MGFGGFNCDFDFEVEVQIFLFLFFSMFVLSSSSRTGTLGRGGLFADAGFETAAGESHDVDDPTRWWASG